MAKECISVLSDKGNFESEKERTMKTSYGFGTTLPVPYEEAILRVDASKAHRSLCRPMGVTQAHSPEKAKEE